MNNNASTEITGDPGRPLNVMFVITSMPVGGAETLLLNLVRRFDRQRVNPMICMMKEQGPLGETAAAEIPVFDHLIGHKFDIAVVRRLRKLFKENHVDAVITVGAGDKMFWGRLAAKGASVPVILSALHSTGWPDGVSRLNRMLTRITDGFIAVADSHADHLREVEQFPAEKVFMIPNGIDTDRFQFDVAARRRWREQVGIPKDAPVVGIVAALRSEKNHELFVEAASRVTESLPAAHFVIAGDGPERPTIESAIESAGLTSNVHLIGSTNDIEGVLSMTDLFALTSHNEASPVSILEALSCERPVVATDVGSINETVIEGETGFLVTPGDAAMMADRWIELLTDETLCESFGQAGRQRVIDNSSLTRMTRGYTELVESIFAAKQSVKTDVRPSIVPNVSPILTSEISQDS